MGSSLVPPMEGSTDDRMAEAMEAASVVIICLSKIYKERPNCRMEAKYANQLFKKGRVKVVYVMMQTEYTTVSEPHCCDGWLGIQIGDALWYPLWEEAILPSSVRSLLPQLRGLRSLGGLGGTQGKAVAKPPPATAKAAPTTPATTTSPSPSSKLPLPAKLRDTVSAEAEEHQLTPDERCCLAWEVLACPAKMALQEDQLCIYMESLGLYEALVLNECDREMLLGVSALLKPLPKKKFEKLMLPHD